MELESWLKQEFDDYVQTCKRCDKIVLAVSVCRFRVILVRQFWAKAFSLHRALYAGMKSVRVPSSRLGGFPIGLDRLYGPAADPAR
jgi:hypothetical protein